MNLVILQDEEDKDDSVMIVDENGDSIIVMSEFDKVICTEGLPKLL